MATADQIEESLRLLTEHADKFFEGTETSAELFELLRICFKDLSELFQGLAERDALYLQDIGRYQWATSVIPAIIRTLEIGPKYGTPLLEQQLKMNFRMGLKSAPTKTVNRVMTTENLPNRPDAPPEV